MPPAFEFLEEAKKLGLLGPASLDLHRRHSLAFAEALIQAIGRDEEAWRIATGSAGGHGLRILDLGSGGGVPGLILAELWPDASIGLLEGSDRRCRLLERWVAEAGWTTRVSVLCGRAEELGRDDSSRGTFDAVVARLFGRPAVTAECAAPFLRVGGLLVVSDPPTGQPEEEGVVPDRVSEGSSDSRWPPHGLAQLGLQKAEVITTPFHFTVLRQVDLCPLRYPRRTGIPAKRPLF